MQNVISFISVQPILYQLPYGEKKRGVFFMVFRESLTHMLACDFFTSACTAQLTHTNALLSVMDETPAAGAFEVVRCRTLISYPWNSIDYAQLAHLCAHNPWILQNSRA